MVDNIEIQEHLLVDRRDLEPIASAQDPARKEVIYCTVRDYRLSDSLEVGDPVLALELSELGSTKRVDLASFSDRPLVLFFGSYT
jgi:hypothetical protein